MDLHANSTVTGSICLGNWDGNVFDKGCSRKLCGGGTLCSWCVKKERRRANTPCAYSSWVRTNRQIKINKNNTHV